MPDDMHPADRAGATQDPKVDLEIPVRGQRGLARLDERLPILGMNEFLGLLDRKELAARHAEQFEKRVRQIYVFLGPIRHEVSELAQALRLDEQILAFTQAG